ncbi:MAG: molecular chaperone HtpG [Proteobacteria bacterium]|nr:molecular chaperone HtpG [Desulfobulbaceae bacterium]MBU4153104.1 molecular chaperone HtpG [Pseudomonadota bacterium]
MTTASTETLEFQSETKKLLDIVIHSLYTEKDIFLRELVSNAADALEKMRHFNLTDQEIFDKDVPLEINIAVDEKENTITLIDTGIGMTRDELIANLGTIAHSGSKTFLTSLSEGAQKDVNIIGQFGVGFYAAFMVAKQVRVQSRSYQIGDPGHEWSSDGTGSYTVSPCPGLHRGTKLIIELTEAAKDYAKDETIKRIIKQYSSFVPFPIKVAGETVNTVQALWTKGASEIKDEEYSDFYKFVGNAYDEPLMRLHFSADAPLAIHALLFVPKENFEKMGFGRMDPGVNLYCQKVLIEQHSDKILPEWLRFLRGVIDSEDLPLNISRQALQDNTLVLKINKVVTKKFLKFLEEQAKNSPETYLEFWKTFGFFLKEGATTDFTHRESIAKLLRFESSTSEPGTLTSLADYVGRMKEGQQEIYYINGPSRSAIESGPYLDAFKKQHIEIIYTMEPIDDFVFSHVGEFDGKKLVSADRADLKLPEDKEAAAEEAKNHLDTAIATSLTKWMKEVLGERVKEVSESKRLVDSPAIIVNPDGFMTASMERIMRASSPDGPRDFGAKNLEINTGHQLIKDLADLRVKDETLARLIVEQIHDNAMVQAGLMVEPRTMVDRNYQILARAVKG